MPPVPSCLFPHPTSHPEDQTDFQLTFTEKLRSESEIPRLLICAEINDRDEDTHQPKKVVVKFAERYDEQAH